MQWKVECAPANGRPVRRRRFFFLLNHFQMREGERVDDEVEEAESEAAMFNG